jgi:hypothetical protein
MEPGAAQATDTPTCNTHARNMEDALPRLRTDCALLAGVDGRTSAARRYRDLVDGYLLDAGDVSSSAQSLARRAASLGIWIEAEEAKLVTGQPVDIGALTTAANAQRRLLENLGIGEPRTRRTRQRRSVARREGI